MRAERCETCRFWDHEPSRDANGDVDSESHKGLCRRNPPAVVYAQLGAIDRSVDYGLEDDGVWPFTEPDDWCGEWRAKDAPPAAEGLRGARGKWPGDETDEQVDQALKDLS